MSDIGNLHPPRTVSVDLVAGMVTVDGEHTHGIGTAEGFDAISAAWLRASWDAKYVYGFSWLGRPVIQLPEDIVRWQELIWAVKPDVVLETGIAHGGSLVLSAGVLKAIGHGRVIGVDIEIRPHNRVALETHVLGTLITLVEGPSTAPGTVEEVKALIAPGETVLVTLDSAHDKEHVRAELEAYAPLVGPGSWIAVADGVMEVVAGAPRTKPDWAENNPRRAVAEFLADHPEFVLEQPPLPFNEGLELGPITYWPDGWLRRV